MIEIIQQEAVLERHSYKAVWRDYVYLGIYSDKKEIF